MTECPKCTSPPDSGPVESIFDSDFLNLIGDRSVDGYCELEAGFTGPWRVIPHDDAFAVLRDGDSKPRGIFKHRETACLVAAVLPAVGSDALYRVQESQLMRGIGHEGAAVAGQLAPGGEDVADALHIVTWLLRSPHSLALFLEAAGYEVLATAGRLVASRQAGEES